MPAGVFAVGDRDAVGLTFIINVAEIVDFRFDVAAGADKTVAWRFGGDVNDFGIIVSCIDDAVTPFIYYEASVVSAMDVEMAGTVLVNNT